MSLFFFSHLEGVVHGFTGMRAIIVDPEFISKELSHLFGLNYISESYLERAYRSFIKNCVDRNVVLHEELEHHKILKASLTARMFFVNHVLLRLSFSSHVKRNTLKKNSAVSRNLFQYYKEWTRFLLISYPYIECHYIKLTQDKPYDVSGVFDPFRRRAQDILNDSAGVGADSRSAARIVDNLFFGREANAESTFVLACLYFNAVGRIVKNCLLRYNLCHSVRVVLKRWKAVLQLIQIGSRVDVGDIDIRAQFYIDKKTVVDPYSFCEGKVFTGGQEEEISDTVKQHELVFFWHIIKFAAFYYEASRDGAVSIDELQRIECAQFDFIEKVSKLSVYESGFYRMTNRQLCDIVDNCRDYSESSILNVLYLFFRQQLPLYLGVVKLNNGSSCFDFSYRQI